MPTTGIRIFIERFVLAILAPFVVGLLTANPVGFDWPLRIIGVIVIIVLAGIAAHFAGWEEWRWERLRGMWWLWTIFGLSAGVALVLWLFPLLLSPPTIVAGPGIGAPPKTELRFQFYGGARTPTAISTENVYYWYAQFSPSIGIKFTDKAGNEIIPPGGSPQYEPTWNIFVVLKEPAAFKQIIATFSNPELLGPTEIIGQTDRSFIFHSMKGIPAGELVISGQP
jgi:hypothetical protein